VRVLAISSASRGCAAAIVEDGVVLASFRLQPERGLPEAIPPAIAALLAATGAPDLVAVIVGPGSFTGLRAGISVAQGVGLGSSIPVVGVTVAEALAEALPDLGGRALWVASAARTGRVFIAREGNLASYPEDGLPPASGPVAMAGDRAARVAAALAARGSNVMLTDARVALPIHVAAVGLRRAAGQSPPLGPVPLYVDAPEAKLPAGGLRAAPQSLEPQ
jgi:tRNA threonylcarbamoyladenosine biosynthesis protein TsaB